MQANSLKNPIHLFYVCGDNLDSGGGGITHVLETLRPIAARGNHVTLYAPGNGRLTPPLQGISIRYVFTPFSGPFAALSFNFFLLAALCFDMYRIRPDIIHTRQLPYSFVPLLAAKLFNVKHYLEVNGIHFDELKIAGSSWFRLLLINFFAAINYRFSDRISVTVDESRYRLKELYGIPPENIKVIPCNAANHRIFSPGNQALAREKLNLAGTDFIIGFVGSLYSWHGIDRLIASVPLMSAIPSLRILIVGDGAERENIEKQVEQSNITDMVTITGMVPYEKVPTFIQAFDLGISFFKPTRPIPGIPMKMYEYMACGCPVLASNIEGYGPLVEELKAGISTDSENINDISRVITYLFQNPDLRNDMGKNGRNAIEKDLNWDTVSSKVESLLREAISS